MRSHLHSLLYAALPILVAMLACNGTSAAPSVSNVRMTTDTSGKTVTSSYAASEAFVVFADLDGLAVGSKVDARWFTVNVEGMEPDAQISTSTYTYESGVGSIYFQLTTSDGGDWPLGSYRVEVLLDGVKVGEQDFTVQ